MARSCNPSCTGKAIRMTQPECIFVALGIQRAMHMCHTVICGLPALQYFSTLSHQWHDFWKKVNEYIMCVLIFSTTFVWNISHYKKKWGRYDRKCIVTGNSGSNPEWAHGDNSLAVNDLTREHSRRCEGR